MPKPRTCPKCGKVIPIDCGFRFDENFNLICGFCKETVVLVVEDNSFDPSKEVISIVK